MRDPSSAADGRVNYPFTVEIILDASQNLKTGLPKDPPYYSWVFAQRTPNQCFTGITGTPIFVMALFLKT